jgi:hypothetical protein
MMTSRNRRTASIKAPTIVFKPTKIYIDMLTWPFINVCFLQFNSDQHGGLVIGVTVSRPGSCGFHPELGDSMTL